MATIKDVAERAGVSVGTVSRVLSKNETVKQPLLLRVQAAMRDLSYKPNLVARALRTNRVDIIGLIVPDITNPFFAQLAKSIEAEATKRGHSVMLANSHDDIETEQNQLTALLDRAARGIVIVATTDGGHLDLGTEVPIVSLDRRFADYPLVSTDHADGSAKLADHIYDLGHRNIVYVAGPQNTEVGRLRKEGFMARVEALDDSTDPISVRIVEGQFDYDAGEKSGREILTSTEHLRPTAVVAANDQLAIGVMRAARDLNLDVPGELSVAGFDDITLATLVVPRLTTLRQPIELLAKSAIERVFLEKKEDADLAVPGDVVVRSSTARLST